MTPDVEHSLLERARLGDHLAFAELYAPYERRLFNVAFRLTGHREDAADVVQEALLRAYLRLADFRGQARFSTWLHRVLVNACLDLIRRRRSRPEFPVDLWQDRSSLVATPDRSMELALERAESREAVMAALLRVPLEFRAVLVLRDIQGYTQDEVALMLDLPVGTVKSRLSRARGQVRRHLLASPGRERELVLAGTAT